MANSPPPKTWRDMLPVHPAADLFPAMSETELRELGEDIKANGLRSPIILWSPGDQLEKDAKEFLLDGRNRLDAMELVGMETVSKSKDGKLSGFLGGSNSLRGTHRAPIVRLHEFVAGHALSLGGRTAGLGKEFREPDTDPYVFVLSANIHRRHLTAEQKRDLIEKLLKARPLSSVRAIAKQTKVDNKTVAKVRAKLEGREEIPHFEARTDTKGRKQPSTKPKKPSKPALPAETEPIGSSPVRHSEVPATSVSPESRRFQCPFDGTGPANSQQGRRALRQDGAVRRKY